MQNNPHFIQEVPFPFLRKAALLLLLLIFSLGISSLKAQSGIEGEWSTPDGGVILIYEVDEKYFGKVVSSDDPEQNAKLQQQEEDIILLKDFSKKNDTKFCCGSIYIPQRDRTLSATITLIDEDTLKIKVKAGVMSATRTWKKLTGETK